MRSSNYAYSIAFEFFHRKGVSSPAGPAKEALRIYHSGVNLSDAMNRVLTGLIS
jgi:hypothetical protein